MNIRIGFNGKRQDPATGLYFPGNGYRHYHPELMRFLSRDSLSPFSGGGVNAYAYCLGDPVNRDDPSGQASVAMVAGNLLGIIGAVAGIAMAIPTGGVTLGFTWALGAATAGSVGYSIWLEREGDPYGASRAAKAAMGFGLATMVAAAGGGGLQKYRDYKMPGKGNVMHSTSPDAAEVPGMRRQ